MNITRLNLKEILPLIKEKIISSHFIALDL